MSTQSQPVSEILRSKDFEDGEPKKKTREDWRKAKELEEARKAGTAPAAVDEEGKDINPHIPQYIASAPWYFGSVDPTLKHQRPQPECQKEYASISQWYNRGVDRTKVATKYRTGACENCGAMTHKKKDCLERPRKVGARYTGADIAPDEFMQPVLSHDYDGKRDRWNGYNPEEHTAIIEEYTKIEEAKRQLKSDKMKQGIVSGDAELEDNDEEDEDKYVDDFDMPGTKVDSKQRITVRNLRIREDTAKYLRNLDPNSAYYDPKTRSMRDNPYKNTRLTEHDVDYAGENFVRFTGDTVTHAKAQVFAWEAHEKGVDVHLLAEPTKLEKLKQEYEKKKEDYKSRVKDSVLEKYGGEEHLEAPPRSLLLAQTEDYLEYSRQGKVVKGQEKQVIRSKYEEDVYINNHMSVWGSYWKDGMWGYKCCQAFIKNSYCTGDKGKESGEQLAVSVMPSSEDNMKEDEPQTLLELHQEKMERKRQKKKEKKKKQKQKKKKRRKSSEESSSDSDSDSSSESETEEEKRRRKVKEALIRQEMEEAKAERLLAMDERKRPYNSMYMAKKPTEEELEAYYLKQRKEEDPMAQLLER